MDVGKYVLGIKFCHSVNSYNKENTLCQSDTVARGRVFITCEGQGLDQPFPLPYMYRQSLPGKVWGWTELVHLTVCPWHLIDFNSIVPVAGVCIEAWGCTAVIYRRDGAYT